jgi:biotin synthase
MTDELQALCFLAGANSIFAGAELLTTSNPEVAKDQQLLEKLGMHRQVLDETPVCINEVAEVSHQHTAVR